MSKYQPLSDRLSDHPEPEWKASFAEIEAVLGFPLPASARRHRAWWGNENQTDKPHKQAWLSQGWLALEVDQVGERVTFRRRVTEPSGKRPLDMKVGAEVVAVASRAPKWGVAAAVAGGIAVLGVVGGLLLRGKMRNPTRNS